MVRTLITMGQSAVYKLDRPGEGPGPPEQAVLSSYLIQNHLCFACADPDVTACGCLSIITPLIRSTA